ncbi:unnamed protein product [Musa acuminata subsp. malaccensis]|uniref:(wild Malaysian banana) hypothetical protein n=1 Tax=Musa acuminata subsp. malaccensis TaxID=214687 RepID=A0A8D7AZY6_MUSAM|nr:unnamed protein product [Musa acuminata subsp. malaccensis]
MYFLFPPFSITSSTAFHLPLLPLHLPLSPPPPFLPYKIFLLPRPTLPVQWVHFEGFSLSKKVGELKKQVSS